ncbi:MAG: ATP-binding protein [Lachnospiraceae bacterium]|nr:ATP-binding protein [Lachnospiraceae bacterium]
MNLIDRPKYISHIVQRLNKGMMLVLIGQRRVGKSFLLRLLKTWIETNRPEASIAYINKELKDFDTIKTADHLYNFALETLPEGGENYLLIDEVQDIEGYENALRSLYAEERCQIVITGSNAYIFSSELSTRLSGRYMEIPVHSLGYDEFLNFHGLRDSDDSLRLFLTIGGLPGLSRCKVDDEAEVRDYLQGVYNTILMKDILMRHKIRNVPFLENLSHFIADNIGKLFSTHNISNYMKSQGEKISESSVSDYVRFICNSLLANQVMRYNIHGKKLLETLNKFYFADHGLRNLLCGFNLLGSIEKIMENVVYNHLLIHGWKVAVGLLRSAEIDFVATRGDEKVYLQITYLLSSEDTVKREFGNLAAIKDNYPKIVVSMDPVGGEFPQYPGIRHYTLRKFLTTFA